MISFRRAFFRSTRTTRSRLQLILFSLAVSLLILYFFVHQRPTKTDYKPVPVQEFNTFPTKKSLATQRSILNESLPSFSEPSNCAYQTCPQLRDDVVNVHVICHTHLDPGWLNSVDGYFFGIQYNRNAQNGPQPPYRHTMPSVLTIFNNVMGALLENSERRFVFSEMSFIWRWWKRLDQDYKEIIRKLLRQGRIDISGGAWASNDEAVSHYSAMIDQCTLGFRFIKNELRSCSQPAVAWQLDLFGHGKEINSLFAQMGYDGILFGRLDYQEKDQRTADKTLQMIWKVNENAPENQRWLFTGILPNLYHPPETLGLKSDVAGSLLRPSDTETISESSSGYSQRLLSELQSQHERYQTNNIAVLYGGDFEYEDATKYFQNIDAMIETINNLQKNSTGKKKFHVHYSNPTCFVHALSKEKHTWPVREGDFMSYAHRAHAFWTGFYTSRAGLKFYERSLSALHQSVRQLSLVEKHVDFNILFQLADTMGLLQHHDTITGTSPVVNIDDALQRIHRAEQSAQKSLLSVYQRILTPSSTTNWATPLFFCRLNESYCQPLAKLEKFSVMVYNPSSVANHVWLRIPLTEQQKIRLDTKVAEKNSINVLEIGIIKLSPVLQAVPIEYTRNQFNELIVRVIVPPLSLQAIPFVSTSQQETIQLYSISKEKCSIENQFYVLNVNEKGSISSIQIKALKKEIQFQQNFAYYISSSSDGVSAQSSGLYVFRPVGTDPPKPIDIMHFYCYKKKGYEEIVQVYSKSVNQSIRLLDNSPSIEFDWIVGRLENNVEFVTSYQAPDIKNEGVFYTDSSGRSLMKRVRDQRDGYKFTQSEKSAGNYYPLVTGILIKDQKEDLQMSVVTDRAEGGGSIQDGQVELMIHRRVFTDDGLGVSEVLNEPGLDNRGLVIRGRHSISIGTCDQTIELYRQQALQSVWKPIISFRDDVNDQPLNYQTWSLVKSDLPPQVNILTIEPIDQDETQLTVLVRFEHMYDQKEHSKYSKSVSFQLDTVFKQRHIIDAKETTLAGNMFKSQAFERLQWTKDSATSEQTTFDGRTVTLNPMEIRSFLIKIKIE